VYQNPITLTPKLNSIKEIMNATNLSKG